MEYNNNVEFNTAIKQDAEELTATKLGEVSEFEWDGGRGLGGSAFGGSGYLSQAAINGQIRGVVSGR